MGSTVMRTVEGLTAAIAISTGRPLTMMSPFCPRITPGVSAKPTVVCPMRRSASRRFIRFMDCPSLLSNRESKQPGSGGDSDVLFSADGVADRTASNRGTEADLPKHVSVTRIEREEVAFAAATEED